jgi:hypothetical protein
MNILRLLPVLGFALCLNVSRGLAAAAREEAWAKVTAAAVDDQPQTQDTLPLGSGGDTVFGKVGGARA